MKLHLVLNHCVRAHDQLRLAAGDAREHVAAFFGFLAAGEPGHAHVERGEPVKQFLEVLLGQYFSRRHQRALPACINADGRRQRGDHGFAAAHIALQQPVHGRAALQVARDFFAHAALCGR